MQNGLLCCSTAILALLANAAVAQQPVEGVHYEKVRVPYGAEDHQIVNVFSPACPRCYRLEDRLTAWAEENDLSIERVPYFHEDRWVEIGRLVIAIQKTIGTSEELIQSLYVSVHEDNVKIDDINTLISALPISEEESRLLEEAYSSREVRNRENEIRSWSDENRILVVPTIIVSDEYYSDPARARGNDNLMLLLDYLASIQ